MPARTLSAMEMISTAIRWGCCDRLCLSDHRSYEVLVGTSVQIQRVQDCRHGSWEIARIGRLLGGCGSWVFDRGTESAQVQYPRRDRCGTADRDPAGSSLR